MIELVIPDLEKSLAAMLTRDYPAPHCGNPGEIGGSKPRDECALGNGADKSARKERLRDLYKRIPDTGDVRRSKVSQEFFAAATAYFLDRDVEINLEEIDSVNHARGFRLRDDSGNVLTVQLGEGVWTGNKSELILSWITANNKGTGLGSAFMRACKSYADAKKMTFRVVQVTNPNFYRRFDWLEEGRFMEYFYEPTKQSVMVPKSTSDDEDEYDLRESPHDPKGKRWPPIVSVVERDYPAPTIVGRSRHSRDKCMDCSKKPVVACHWANGYAMAWFCLKHLKAWFKEDERELVGVWFLKDGEMPKDIRKNPAGTVKILKLSETLSHQEILSRLEKLTERGDPGIGHSITQDDLLGVLRGDLITQGQLRRVVSLDDGPFFITADYPDPHCGRPGEIGGSLPRDECAGLVDEPTDQAKQPWEMTRDEFRRGTRILFHGTTRANVAELIRDQKPDPEEYGSRTDRGFFGEGFYTTAEPSDAYGKTIVALDINSDANILAWETVGSKLYPDEPPDFFDNMISQMNDLSTKFRGKPLTEEHIDRLTPGSGDFSHTEFIRASYRYAVRNKYDIFQPVPSETIILNPDVVSRIYRPARSFSEAVKKYSHRGIVETAIAEGREVPSAILDEYPDLTQRAEASIYKETEKSTLLSSVRRSLENLVEKVLGIARAGEGPGYHDTHYGRPGEIGGSRPRGEGEAAPIDTEPGQRQANILEGLPEDLKKAIKAGKFDEETIRRILVQADKTTELAIDEETRTSPLIQKLAQQFDAQIEGFDYRIKGRDSLARKIATDMIEKNLNAEEAASDIADAVRYTLVFDGEKFVEQVGQAQDLLIAEGWTQYDQKWKNFVPTGDGYDGYNTVMENPETGERFELQFHTPDTWQNKVDGHSLYEELRVLPQGSPRRLQIWNQMVQSAEALPRPTGWDRLRGQQVVRQ